MKPAQHDYLPDVVHQRRIRFLRESTLTEAAIYAALSAVCGLVAACCPPVLMGIFAGVALICCVEFVVTLWRWNRLGKERP